MPTINGTKGAYPQPSRYGRSESGLYTVPVWEGTKDEINNLIPVIEGNRGLWEVSESPTGGKYRMEARIPLSFSNNEEVINTWEVFANPVEKDILESDLAMVEGLTDREKRVIRKYASNQDLNSSPALTSGSDAEKIYNKIIIGETAIRVPQQVLRHTQTVSNNYTVKASIVNVKRIITTGSMEALEGVPNDILVTLPFEVSSRDGKVYGWYKQFPTVRVSAGHRTQIEQEWEYGLWDTDLYRDPL